MTPVARGQAPARLAHVAKKGGAAPIAFRRYPRDTWEQKERAWLPAVWRRAKSRVQPE